MNPFKLIRKLGKALRGGATFRDMFLGVFLGFAVGMIPGVNLTVIILLFLLFFLNTTGALAGLSIALGKILCVALAPVTYRIGYIMIHNTGLGGLVRSASNTPVLALMDLHVYCLIGALPLIIVIGGILAWFVARSIMKMRSAVASVTGGNEKVRKVADSKFTKVLMRIVFGKQKTTMAEMADKKSPIIRKGRVIAATVLVVLLVVLQFLFLDSMVRKGLVRSIGAVNGAQVDIDKTDLSLAKGRLVIEGMSVTDASRPTHNLIQADRLVADVSISDLLAGRLVMDLVECDAMRMDAERKSPGEVYRQAKSEEKSPADLVGGLAGKMDKRAEYLTEIKKYNDRLGKLREYLKSDEPKAQDKSAAAGPADRRIEAMGYLKMSAKDLLAKNPTWVIRDVKISRIELRPDLPTFTVEGKNLSSHPSLIPEKMTLSANPDEEALKEFIAKASGGKDKTGEALDKLMGGKKDKKSENGDKKKGVLDNLLGK